MIQKIKLDHNTNISQEKRDSSFKASPENTDVHFHLPVLEVFMLGEFLVMGTRWERTFNFGLNKGGSAGELRCRGVEPVEYRAMMEEEVHRL